MIVYRSVTLWQYSGMQRIRYKLWKCFHIICFSFALFRCLLELYQTIFHAICLVLKVKKIFSVHNLPSLISTLMNARLAFSTRMRYHQPDVGAYNLTAGRSILTYCTYTDWWVLLHARTQFMCQLQVNRKQDTKFPGVWCRDHLPNINMFIRAPRRGS